MNNKNNSEYSLGIFDTHCHLSDRQFLSLLSTVLQEARDCGVHHILSVATGIHDWQATLDSKLSNNIFIALGIHPLWAHQSTLKNLENLEHLLKNTHSLVGEIGLDFSIKDASQKKQQQELFTAQLVIAKKYHRPIVLHHRQSVFACLKSITENQFTCGGFAHAFSGSLESAKQFLDAGFLLGLGSVLFRNNALNIRKVIQYLPADGFVLESDAPFMLPEKSNHPKNTAKIANIVADLRKQTFNEIVEQSTKNAFSLIHFE